MSSCRRRNYLGSLGPLMALLACGSPKGDATEAGDTSGGDASGGDTTAPTTGETASASGTTGGPAASCPAGWEVPAAIVVTSLHVVVPDADVAVEFDLEAAYPDGTAAACVRWNGAKLAAVRLAFGPAVGDGPQSLLEVIVTDGERDYGVDGWPPPDPSVYDGLTVVYTLAGEQTRTWDFAAEQGIGFVHALWVPRRTGEHIVLDAKLMMTPDGTGADVGFYIDATIAPASAPTEPFCGELDSKFKCDTAGCAGWLETETVTDLKTCGRETAHQCVAELGSTGNEAYDSAFYRVVDGVTQLRRVGGEACHLYGAEFPEGWSECGVGPGDPAECHCVCAKGKCPGETNLGLLTSCELLEPCPDLDVSLGPDASSGDCTFKVAAGDIPAALRVFGNAGDPDWDDRIFLRGDGTASWLHGACDVSCIGSCEDRAWGVPRLCKLREPGFFADCEASTDPAVLAQCFDVAQWFLDCKVEFTTCP